jgi:hypothetical protein
LRVATSVILTWIVERLTPPGTVAGLPRVDTLCVLGFVIGVFPPVIWQMLRSFLKVLGLRMPNIETDLPIGDLDGLNIWHRARPEEEDIENFPSMATADIVDLLLQTRFPPDRIIDWVDQAILYTHLGLDTKDTPETPSRRRLLRQHGIRTASSLVYDYARALEHHDQPAVEDILPHEGRSEVRSIIDALMTNPNLDLIRQWRGLPAAEFAGWASPPAALPNRTDLARVR